MKNAALICVGKIRSKFWQEAAAHYLALLKPWRKVQCIELKDSMASPLERKRQEGERIIRTLHSGDFPIALHEKGRQLSSQELAQFLKECDLVYQLRPAFIIGGPYGLDEILLHATRLQLSLSAMTWPHELARVLLLEQLYRAESILRGTPYHH